MISEFRKQSQTPVPALLDNKVQFIYETAFAKRELKGLGVKAEEKLEERVYFEIQTPYDEELLVKRLAHFEKVGDRVTDYSQIVAKRNQKKSDNQFLTHWYYPYKGKFHPRLVRSIFNIIGLRAGQAMLDNFLGSGTCALEAHLLAINSIGFDISPLCALISKVKVSAGKIAEDLPRYRDEAVDSMKKDYDKSSAKGKGSRRIFEGNKPIEYQVFLNGVENDEVRDFYRLAQLIFASDRGRRGREFGSFTKNLDTMIRSAFDLHETEAFLGLERLEITERIEVADARDLPLEDESVDAIVTSPPYSIALNYMQNDKFALEEMDEDIDRLSEKCIGVTGKGEEKLSLYETDMKKCYSEMYRVLRSGAQCVVVIGEAKYDGRKTRTVEDAITYCRKIGFSLIEDIPKKIFGLYNTITDEKVLFLRK